MKTILALSCILCVFLTETNALTTFKAIRRGQITESVKQLNLPNSEIDPNVAPTVSPNAVEEVAASAENEADNEIKNPSAEEVEEIVEEGNGNAAASTGTGGGGAGAGAAAAEVAETNEIAPPVNEDDKNPINRFCKCSESHCDCCRNFALPIIPVRGPGCARVSYLGNEKMAVTIKYGDIVLASRTISGKNTKPICVGLPGGYSRFCGRVYGLAKTQDNFKACLGLELRAEDEVEASLRVSCFKFGPKGLAVAEAEPLPVPEAEKDDDDEDDFFGLGGGGGDDTDDYDDNDEDDEADDDEAEDDDDDDEPANDQSDPDYDGFSLLGDALFDESAESSSPVASRNEPIVEGEAAAEVAGSDIEPVKKTKKNKKKKKNTEDDTFDILGQILEFFS